MSMNVSASRLLLLAIILAVTPAAAWTQSTEPARAAPFVPTGRVWGYSFGDYFYKTSGDTARWGSAQYVNEAKDMHAGELRRLYLGYDYNYSRGIFSRVLLEANSGTTFAGGSYGLLVKLGYVSWRNPLPSLPVTVNVGLIPTPVFTLPERTWGYRSIEKEALDVRGFGPSADQGVSVEGTMGKNGGFSLMVGNGSGTKPATERAKAVYGSLVRRFLDKKLTVELMASFLPKSGDRDRTIDRLFVSYEPDFAKFGLEVARVRDQSPADLGEVSGTEARRLLASGFVSVPLRRDSVGVGISIFARYDFYDPDRDFAAGKGYVLPEPFYTQKLYIFGLDIAPLPRVHVMPNLWMMTYRARGGAVSRDADVVARMTFYFIFG